MKEIENRCEFPDQWVHRDVSKWQALEVLWDLIFFYSLALTCLTKVSKVVATFSSPSP